MKFGVLAAAVLASSVAVSQEQPTQSGEWDFGLGIGQIGIDSEAASQSRIDDSALTFDLFATYRKANWLGTGGLQFISYDDEDQFTVSVRNNFSGNVSSEDSSATGMLLHAAYGPMWDLQQNTAVKGYLQGGLAVMVSSERSVDFCENCPEEDIDVNGGVFGRAGVLYNFSSVAIGASYTQYISGDLDNSLMLTIATSFD